MAYTEAQLLEFAPDAEDFIFDAVLAGINNKSLMAKYGISQLIVMQHMLAHIKVESQGLTRVKENLNYSAEGLLRTFRTHFTPSEAAACAHNPQAIANKAYGGRYGNTGPNDGWLYSGAGLLQVTFKDNISLLAKTTGLNVIEHPDLIVAPGTMFECALGVWKMLGATGPALIDDITGSTRHIQGGVGGLPDREAALHLAKNIFKEW